VSDASDGVFTAHPTLTVKQIKDLNDKSGVAIGEFAEFVHEKLHARRRIGTGCQSLLDRTERSSRVGAESKR
jgi:hypothetical protein